MFGDPTELFFDVLTKYPAPPLPLEPTPVNPYRTFTPPPPLFFLLYGLLMRLDKRREGEEIARLNDAMTQILAKTEEYKKDLLTKRKQLEEVSTANVSGAE